MVLKLTILLISVTFTGLVSSCQVCPDNWNALDNSNICYRIFQQDKVNFEDAVAGCNVKQDGSRLLGVSHADDVMKDLQKRGQETTEAIRIDGIKKQNGNRYQWYQANGEGITKNMNLFFADRKEELNNEATLTVIPSGRAWQQSYEKKQPLGYACEMPMNECSRSSAVREEEYGLRASDMCDVCPEGWSLLRHMSSCYKVFTDKMTLSASIYACNHYGSSLMTAEQANSVVSDIQQGKTSYGILRMNAVQAKVGKKWVYKTHEGGSISKNIDGIVTDVTIRSRATATIRSNDGVWQQRFPKSSQLNFVCVKGATSEVCSATEAPCSGCPGDWVPLYSKNICYKVFNEDNDAKLSFVNAAKSCPTKGVGTGSLLSVANVPDVMEDLTGTDTNGACRVNAKQYRVGGGKWVFKTYDGTKIAEDITKLANDRTRFTDSSLTVLPLTGDIQQKYRGGTPMNYICEMPMSFNDEYCTSIPQTTTQPATTPMPVTGSDDGGRMAEILREENFNIENTLSGQIYSPNFGVEAYPKDWSANYYYQPKSDKTVKLVGFYNLDDADETGFCADRITIHEGLDKEKSMEIGPYCGEGALPDQIIEPGSSGKMIRFESDAVKQKPQSFYYFQARTFSHGKQVELDSDECVTLNSPNKRIEEKEEGGSFIVCGPNQQRLRARFLAHPDQCFYEVKFYEGNSETTRKHLHETQCNDAYVVPKDIRTVDENCLSIEMEYKSTGTPREFLNLQVCSTA